MIIILIVSEYGWEWDDISGSRFAGGDVPGGGWNDGKLCVYAYSPGDTNDYLRAREVVSPIRNICC